MGVSDSSDLHIASHGKVNVTCPDCGFNKDMLILNLSRRGFACDICSDGISIPNKFIRNILKQLGVQFIPEKSFYWSKKKKYDVFIKDNNCIIEAHGIQHYEESSRGRSLKDEQTNDDLKRILAFQNGIENYIVLDFRYTQLEYMVDAVLKSKLSEIYDLSTVDFNKAFADSQKSIIKEIAEYRDSLNGEISTTRLCEIFQVSKCAMIRYLKVATQCNILKYPYKPKQEMHNTAINNIKNKKTKRIYMYSLDGLYIKNYKSARCASSENNININNIYNCCNKITKSSGGFIWMYNKVDNLIYCKRD